MLVHQHSIALLYDRMTLSIVDLILYERLIPNEYNVSGKATDFNI